MTMTKANDAAFVEHHNALMRRAMQIEDRDRRANLIAEIKHAMDVRILQRLTGEELPAYIVDGVPAEPKVEYIECSACSNRVLKSDTKAIGAVVLCRGCRQ